MPSRLALNSISPSLPQHPPWLNLQSAGLGMEVCSTTAGVLKETASGRFQQPSLASWEPCSERGSSHRCGLVWNGRATVLFPPVEDRCYLAGCLGRLIKGKGDRAAAQRQTFPCPLRLLGSGSNRPISWTDRKLVQWAGEPGQGGQEDGGGGRRRGRRRFVFWLLFSSKKKLLLCSQSWGSTLQAKSLVWPQNAQVRRRLSQLLC